MERHCSCLCHHLQTAFERVMATAAIRRFETGISARVSRRTDTPTCHQVQSDFCREGPLRGGEQAAPEKLFLFFSLIFYSPPSEGKKKKFSEKQRILAFLFKEEPRKGSKEIYRFP